MSSTLQMQNRLPPEVPPWWERYGEPGDVDPAAVPVLEYLLDRAAGRRSKMDRPEIEELIIDLDLEAVFSAINTVEQALDRAASNLNGSSGSGIIAARKRVHRTCRELCEAAIRVYTRQSRELLRDISHDVRKPLNSIVFLANGLYSELSGRLQPGQKRQVGTLYMAATSLLNLVNDLLDLSRAEEDEVEEAAEVPFSIDGVLDDIVDLLGPIAEHHGVELSVRRGVDGAYRGDPQLVSRLLINLVLNAVEATGEGGQVEVVVEDEKREGVRLEIVDDGPGVDRERVRELLTAGDSGWIRLLHGGTEGLGLLIVGRLVRKAGGKIGLDSRKGSGTRFAVVLPFEPA